MFGFLASGAVLALFLIWASLALVTDVLKIIYFGLAALVLLVARAWLRRQNPPASQDRSTANH